MVTGSIFKGLVFDGVDSTQYGVYITGEAVYNAPNRDVELIEIPGRNGAYALDKGRFNNIEVTYPAGIFGKDESEFAQAISDFRNALASRVGYKRLTDDYNSDEYRMAVYSSGLEVSPAQLKAGQFDITFNCKPQRFLTSGETQSNVTSGGTITNPTLFESHPLLLVDGYGTFNINGEPITIQQGAVMGRVVLVNSKTISGPSMNCYLDKKYLTGDIITLATGTEYKVLFKPTSGTITNVEVTVSQSANFEALIDQWYSDGVYLSVLQRQNPITFAAGTQTIMPAESVEFEVTIDENGVTKTVTVELEVAVKYRTYSDRDLISIDGTFSFSSSGLYPNDFLLKNGEIYCPFSIL